MEQRLLDTMGRRRDEWTVLDLMNAAGLGHLRSGGVYVALARLERDGIIVRRFADGRARYRKVAP